MNATAQSKPEVSFTRERLSLLQTNGDLVVWFLWRCQRCTALMPEAQRELHRCAGASA